MQMVNHAWNAKSRQGNMQLQMVSAQIANRKEKLYIKMVKAAKIAILKKKY